MPQKQSLTGKEAQTNVNLPLFLDFWILVNYANMPKYGNINKAMVSKEKQSKNSLVKIRVRVAATLFLSLQFSVLLLTSTNWIIQIFHPTQNICTSYISFFSFGNTYEGTRGPGCLLTGLEKNVFYISYNSNFDIYFYKCFFLFNFEIFRPGHILGNGGCGCLLPEAVKA